MRLSIFLAIAIAALPAGAASARELTAASPVLGDVHLVAPEGEPDAFVVLIADRAGLTDADRAAAATLVAGGAAVALIDLPALLAKQAEKDGDGCHYVFGTLEDFSRAAERRLGMRTWRWPVLLGFGDGGTLAYLALAQAPANTAAGAVSVGFSPTLTSRNRLCPGAPTADPAAHGAITYAPMTPPAPWVLVGPAAPGADVAPFVAAGGQSVVAADPAAAAVAAALDLARGPADTLADLPLTELPANDPIALAVFISGDGGWRDLDKTIGEHLAAHGVAVVGLDSLRYFWSRREPAEVAADIDRIVAHYGQAWNLDHVALLGYSFGADILPLAWEKLSAATRGDTVLVGLLGLARSASLEVTVSGWLGFSPSDAVDLAPPLAALPADRVLCVYGNDELTDGGTGCTLLTGATLLETGGGHHFDGDYAALAQTIRARIAAAAAGKEP